MPSQLSQNSNECGDVSLTAPKESASNPQTSFDENRPSEMEAGSKALAPSSSISVILSTRNRSDILYNTLESFIGQLDSPYWEIIVVDNGSEDETNSVLTEFRKRLPLLVLSEPLPGKTRCLNKAVGVAKGSLLVFTDDDVIASPQWLREILRGYHTYQNATVLCGPIVPLFPESTPTWLRTHSFAAPAFARFEPQIPEGPLPLIFLPFGPNFAVRADAFKTHKFREDLGPSNDGLLHDETELCTRLRQNGARFYFLPKARVEHYVRAEQLTLPWLFDRAFRLGRSNVAVHMSRPGSDNRPNGVRELDLGLTLNQLYGSLCEISKILGTNNAAIIGKREFYLQEQPYKDLLSPMAYKWLFEI